MNDQKLAITTGSWVRGVAVIAIAYALFMVHDFLLVLLVSIIIASAIELVTAWAKRHGIPRLPAVVSVYIFSAIFLASIFYFLLLPLLGEMSSFIRTLTIYSNSVVSGGVLTNLFETQNIFSGLDTPALIGELNSYLNSLAGFLSQGVFSGISLVFGGVLSFVLIIVLSFYLSVQEGGINKFLKIITPVKHENYVIDLWRRSQAKIGLWMQGQIALAVIVTVLVYIGLLIVGIPHALLLAVLAGILEIIPLFGPVLAAIPALFVAFIFGGTTTFLIVGGIYILVQQIESNLLYPLVVKKVVGVPPMISIAALVVGGELAGFLGLIVSVPIAAAIMEFLSDLEKNKAVKAEIATS